MKGFIILNFSSKLKFFFILILMYGCKVFKTSSGFHSQASSFTQGAIHNQQVAWPKRAIPVCFVNPSDKNTKHRAWLQMAVEDTWQKDTVVKFFRWDTCKTEDLGNAIRVEFLNTMPRVEGFGRDLKVLYLPENYSDNSDGASAYVDCWKDGGKNLEKCTKSIGIHEFGHALGLRHEQDRIDTPEFCSKNLSKSNYEGGPTPLNVGDWDKDSVMNYCNKTKYSEFNRLSKGDIAAIEKLYGKLPD